MTVADHLTLNELWRRVKKAKDPIEKDCFLAVYHANGASPPRGSPKSPSTPPAGSRRRCSPSSPRRNGRGCLVSPEGAILELYRAPPPDGGLWTGPKLRAWVERELGKKLSFYPIYRLVREMGFALRVPRPRHAKADGAAGEAFKTTSSPKSRRRGPKERG